jgi:hypothetical protein
MLTPEEREISKQMGETASKAILQSLHEDNLEIFGEDYFKK